MTWTKDKPTKPGFYWLRDARGPDIVQLLAEPLAAQNEFAVLCFNRDRDEAEPLSRFIQDGWEWAGPIPQPDEPTTEPAAPLSLFGDDELPQHTYGRNGR